MGRILRKTWPFLIIWGLMGLYSFTAPIIHDRFFVREARPIQVNVQLPMVVNESKAGLDAFYTNDEQSGVYQIIGWAFPTVDKSIPAGDYERQIVLVAPTGNYVFAAQTTYRKDVQKYFSDLNLNMDVSRSGFSAFINRNSLKPGIYAVGMIFTNTASGTAYYMNTDRCVTRTPNLLILEDPGISNCQASTSQETGKPVQVNVELPGEISQAKSGLDALVKSDEQGGVYQLWGWAFPTVDKSIPASDYERQVVLITSTGNYIFASEAVERTDVQSYFSDLGMDVNMSGVLALINRDALETGIYGVGLIFTNTVSDLAYYINTGRCMTYTSNDLVLESPGNSACQSTISWNTGKPVQVNVELPGEISQAKSGLDSLVKSNGQGEVYQLWGWAFPTVDKSVPASDYERQVVLVTSTGNYVFAAEAVERTDVQSYFSDLGMDVNMSGVSALINRDALKPGVYWIGLIFTHTSIGVSYYIDTGRCLQYMANELSLEGRNSPICQLP